MGRKYTVDDIDRMRAALVGTPGSDRTHVEDQLRTYLVGGVRPEELEERAAKLAAEFQAAIAVAQAAADSAVTFNKKFTFNSWRGT